MDLKKFDVEIKSLQPMLHKSARGVDVTDPLVKRMREITSKPAKKRTEADLEEMDWLEFQIALYWNGKIVYVPDFNIVGCIRDGAKAQRQGKEITAGIDVTVSDVPLIYDGPKTPEELYAARWVDRRMVKNKGTGGSVMRIRPRFNQWALRFTLAIDPHVADPIRCVRPGLEHAGARVGLGDFRPRFGRFEVTQWKEVKP